MDGSSRIYIRSIRYRLKLDFENGGLQEKKKRYRFKEVYDLWLEQYKNTVKESTLNKTLGLFRNHILPYYGKMYIENIKITHSQDSVNLWSKNMKNFRTVNTYATLVFKHAIKLGLIQTDPTAHVTMHKIRKKVKDADDDTDRNFFNTDELVEFLKASEEEGTKWYTLFHVLAHTGMRKGELLALTWSDINFTRSTMRINKTMTRG